MKSMNWSAVASIAASISALLSLIGIVMNVYYNKKNYKANLEIKSRLSILNSIKKLVPDYIAQTSYALYIYSKDWSNANDKRLEKSGALPPGVIIGKTEISDYDAQLTRAKVVYFELETELRIYGCCQLIDDVENMWNILSHDNLKEISSTATNQYVSKEEQQIFDEFNKRKDKLNKNFSSWYKDEFRNLIK